MEIDEHRHSQRSGAAPPVRVRARIEHLRRPVDRRRERLADAALTAFVAGAGTGLWGLQADFDLLTWLPVAAGVGAVLGYLLGPRIGYLFVMR